MCVRAEKVFGEFLSWDLEEASSRLPLKSGQAVTLTVHIKVELDFSGQESLLQDLNDGEWSGTFSANYKRGASVPRAGCHGNGDTEWTISCITFGYRRTEPPPRRQSSNRVQIL